jgi:hypothetical protein
MLCFLCGMDWVHKYYLDEFRLQKVMQCPRLNRSTRDGERNNIYGLTRIEIRDFRPSLTYKVGWLVCTYNNVLRPPSNMILFCTMWVCTETWERRNLCRTGVEPVPSRHELIIIHIRARMTMSETQHLWDIISCSTLVNVWCPLMYRIWTRRYLQHSSNTYYHFA